MVKPLRIDLYRFQGSHTKKRTLEVRTYDKQKQNDCLEHKVLSFCLLAKYKFSWRVSSRAIKRGEGVKGRAIKEKRTLPFFQLSKISTAIKLEGGGGLGLNGPAIKRIILLRLPLPDRYFL